MKLLEKYYNKKIKVEGMPEFKDLTEEYKLRISGTFGFAVYQVNAAAVEFNKVIRPFP